MSRKPRGNYARITQSSHGWIVTLCTEHEMNHTADAAEPWLYSTEELVSHWRPTQKAAERYAARRLRERRWRRYA